MALTTVQAGLIGNSQVSTNNAVNVGVPLIENIGLISASYAITTGSNAISCGPITLADGVTFTITDGSAWTIV